MPYKYDKICPQCGRMFYVTNPIDWVYKSCYRKNGHDEVMFLCRWSCYRSFERENGIKRYGNRDGSLFDGVEDMKEEDLKKSERTYHKRKDTKTRRADNV